MTEQLTLLAEPELKVGDVVWWTPGLRYLCATYDKGGKLRPENSEPVTILSVDVEKDDIWIDVPDWPTAIITCRRWISTDPKVPCSGVLEAYGIYL